MGKGKRIEAAEFELPEAIVQHIQSFLSGKEAVQTTILSKSWNNAWLTRPNLHFDQQDFVWFPCDFGEDNGFWNFVNKTVQRYEKFKLKIESFKLWMLGICSDKVKCSCFSLANELITKAMKMGAIDLNFKICCPNEEFVFPYEVFGLEKLVRLSVSGCKIGLGEDGKVGCWRLLSLDLGQMCVDGDIILSKISSCHLIEKLSLSVSRYYTSNVISSALKLSPFIEFGKRDEGSVVVDVPINVYEFRKLTYLVLNGVNVNTLFFDGFSSKFPCLRDFTLRDCDDYKGIQISSSSLERISFTQHRMLRVKFDVPSICKFTFSGRHIPSLSFKTGRSNWESVISISSDAIPSAMWFLNLNKLLTKLSLSRVSLSLELLFYMSIDLAGKLQVLYKPAIENLNINVPSKVCPALFDTLFGCCRPMFVTQRMSSQCDLEGVRTNDVLETVYKRFIRQGDLIWLSAYQSACGLCDVEERNVEFFDEAVSAWRPLLLDCSTSFGAELGIRLHLRWEKV